MTQRTVLLTGANGKFGRQFTNYLLRHGHRVVAVTQTDESFRSLELECTEVERGTGELVGIATNLNATGSSAYIREILQHRKYSVDCLINAARSIDFLKTASNGVVSRDDFMNEYLMDVIVPYELGMELALATGSALVQIINIGSQYGTVAAHLPLYDDPLTQSPIQYSVAKAALVHLTRELAIRLAARNIQVNCISYGGVEGRVADAFKSRYASLSPIGRMLLDEDVIAPLQMLFATPSMAVTGHTLHADGGWSLW